jgi:hypothetical protein
MGCLQCLQSMTSGILRAPLTREFDGQIHIILSLAFRSRPLDQECVSLCLDRLAQFDELQPYAKGLLFLLFGLPLGDIARPSPSEN